MNFPAPGGADFWRCALIGGALAAVLFLTVMSGLHVHSLDEDLAGAAGGCHLCHQLDHLGMESEAQALERAIAEVYRKGKALTVDQGGGATTMEFVKAALNAIR